MSILSNFNETTSICNTCIHNGECKGTVCYGYESEQKRQHRMNNDLISRDALQYKFDNLCPHIECKKCRWYSMVDSFHKCALIENAPTVEEIEKPFITECRDTAIKKNLPLYFVYYEETGILEVYVTETKELFEKRRCSKHLPDYKFKEAVIRYLDWYSDWKDGAE